MFPTDCGIVFFNNSTAGIKFSLILLPSLCDAREISAFFNWNVELKNSKKKKKLISFQLNCLIAPS